MQEATAPQRLRALALLAWMLACAGVGALAHLPSASAAPAPCGSPARHDGLLTCDGNGSPARARAWLVGAKLDVNAATQADLEAIPGVGPSLASAIVTERAQRGRFRQIDELDSVVGVGEKTLAKLTRVLDVLADAR